MNVEEKSFMILRPTKIRRVQKEQQLVDDVEQMRDFINSLNHYSLEKIFMLLPIGDRINMGKVCTKWREVCKLAWYDIKKYKCSHTMGGAYNNQLLTQSYVENLILNCGAYLRELILSKICTSSIMPIIGKHCKNLTRLEFVFDESLPLNTNNYIRAFKKLNKMKIIKIHDINRAYRKPTKFKPAILHSLPEGINEIHVVFERSTLLRAPFFSDLEKFKNLHSLTLSRCNLDNIIQQISEKITLVYLNLEDCWIDHRSLHMNADYFNKLVNLEHIHLFRDIGSVSQNFEKNIFNTCKNLRYFNLSKPYSSKQHLKTSIENWKSHNNLEYLAIVRFLDYDSAIEIVKYCNNLKYLSFKTNVRETVLQKLTELENLESLEFIVSHDLSDESILAISNNCTKLKHLEILYGHRTLFSDIEYEDDDAGDVEDINYDNDDKPAPHYTVFDELSKLEYLESLNVSGLFKVTNRVIIAVANSCNSLKYLNISHCNYITEAGLNAIVSMESLQKLNVSYVKSVTNSFITKLKGLTSFEATRCKKITDSGIIQFIKNCPDLEHLHLFNTNITVNTIMAADQETEYRKNDIILHIHCGHRVLKKSCRPIIKSKWLVVHYHTQIFIRD